MLDQFDPRLDADFPAVDPAVLRARLEPLLPAGGLLTRLESIRAYETDGLPAYRALPAVVALPETVEQVAAILRACRDLGVPDGPHLEEHPVLLDAPQHAGRAGAQAQG